MRTQRSVRILTAGVSHCRWLGQGLLIVAGTAAPLQAVGFIGRESVVDGGTLLVSGTNATLGIGNVTLDSANAVFAGSSAHPSVSIYLS